MQLFLIHHLYRIIKIGYINKVLVNGRLKLNVAPFPSSLFFAHILPPYASTIFLHIYTLILFLERIWMQTYHFTINCVIRGGPQSSGFGTNINKVFHSEKKVKSYINLTSLDISILCFIF